MTRRGSSELPLPLESRCHGARIDRRRRFRQARFPSVQPFPNADDGLVQNAWLGSRQLCLNQPRPVRSERRDAQRRRPLEGDGPASIHSPLRRGERDYFNRRQHLFGLYNGESWHGGDGDRLMERVDTMHASGIYDRHPQFQHTRVARPVAAGAIETPAPARLAATVAAALSSGTSPASRRATTTSR